MPTLRPLGYTLQGGLQFGSPFYEDFLRTFRSQVGAAIGGANAGFQQAQLGGPPSRDFGNFGPPGGPGNPNKTGPQPLGGGLTGPQGQQFAPRRGPNNISPRGGGDKSINLTGGRF